MRLSLKSPAAHRGLKPLMATCVLWLAACGSGTPPAPPPAQAWTDDGYVVAGPYTLSYQAQPLQDLNAEVAKRYGLQPRAGRGLLTIVLNRAPAGAPVEATLAVEVRTLTGELREANLRRVEDAGAVSYLAEFAAPRREWLVFQVAADVKGGPHLQATFRREFFAD
ncbi:MAG: hypothetical protein RJB26_981 [Pseudomonadota bacterium]